jgi:hypothetical protein
MSEESLVKIIYDLYRAYENNPIMINKLTHYIEHLPEYLENTNNTILEREKRKFHLESESDTFIQKFLHNNKYYYHVSSELFFEYKNDNKYYIVKEDDIQHIILSTISAHKTLMDWKQKLKISILRKIKDRDIFSCIPESETIQTVINTLYPTICDTRDKAKYFLTILGDILLKKCGLIYFVNSKAKPFLKELNRLSCMLFGTTNLFNFFKVKYYDHKYSECRVVDLQEHIILENWMGYFKQENAINLFCVAAHYSSRFGDADAYLQEQCKDECLKEYALYLKNNNESQIIDNFYQKNIEHSADCSISWKNMQYLWKQFIETEKLPNVFFTMTLKTKLIEKFKYDEQLDLFLDCTSKLLPVVGKFIQFWNEHIETNYELNDENNEELEVDELCSLFTYYNKSAINEKNVLDLIRHYFQEVCIEDDKYILHTKCKLWDKKNDITESIKKYRIITPEIEFQSEEIPIDLLYQFYLGCKNRFNVSKRYFEQFIKNETQLYVVEENFIKVDSFGNI